VPEGAHEPSANDELHAMTNWTMLLMLGVTTIWIVLLSSVAYLAARSPARQVARDTPG
jgi:hypothetical protein